MTFRPLSWLPRDVCGNLCDHFPKNKIMRIRFAMLCLLAVGADAFAADSTTPNSPAPKKPAARQVVAPAISVTRAVRNADGSLSFVCDERPNPRATQLIEKARAAHAQPDQH